MPRRGRGRASVSRASFPCPLCREVGRAVTLEAELEPEPPLVIVTDLHGDCAHAAAFGELRQTLEEAWALIAAALTAASIYDVRPIDAPPSSGPRCQQPRGTSWSARSAGSRRQGPAAHGS
jgi:hypothetical protein